MAMGIAPPSKRDKNGNRFGYIKANCALDYCIVKRCARESDDLRFYIFIILFVNWIKKKFRRKSSFFFVSCAHFACLTVPLSHCASLVVLGGERQLLLAIIRIRWTTNLFVKNVHKKFLINILLPFPHICLPPPLDTIQTLSNNRHFPCSTDDRPVACSLTLSLSSNKYAFAFGFLFACLNLNTSY